MDIQHFSALTPLLELKERTEFVSLSSVIFEMIKQEQAENREILGEFPLDNDVNLSQWLKTALRPYF